MKIIKPSVEILTEIDGEKIIKLIELAGRTCYKSEDKITDASARAFVKRIVKSGHHSVLEHVNITVKFICDRGVTHELIRHRLASYSQESTRYVDYEGGLTVVCPPFWSVGSAKYKTWLRTIQLIEKTYTRLRSLGASPQEARSILPNSLKTEIVATANLREWRHILTLRTARAAHPQIQEIMSTLLNMFKSNIPIVFDDIGGEDNE